MRQVSRLIVSLWAPQAVHAAAELGVADALADEPRAAADLAAQLRTHPEATERLLRALVALELLEERDGLFALTDAGRCLVTDSPTSVRAWARLMGGHIVWNAWGQLTDCVRTGQPVFALPSAAAAKESARGTAGNAAGPFERIADDDDAAAIFHRAMFELTRGTAPSIVKAVCWDDVRTIVDLGGGTGALLAAILDARPDAQGRVFDRPHARDAAEQLFIERGLDTRASFLAGDLFADALPPADVYVLKSVIHDWDDARSLEILRACARAMSAEARLLMVEVPSVPAATDASLAWMLAFSDLNMLVNVGGRERTAEDYRALLEQSGLRVRAVLPTTGPYCVFEAICA